LVGTGGDCGNTEVAAGCVEITQVVRGKVKREKRREFKMFNRTQESPVPVLPALTPAERIAALGAREIELVMTQRRKAKEVDLAEVEAGEALLDSEDDRAAGAAVEKILRMKAEQVALAHAIDVLHKRRLEAVKTAWQAEVEGLRTQANEVQREIDALHSQTAPLLKQLAELEGVKVDELVLSGPLRSGVLQTRLESEFPVRIVIAERRTLSNSGLIETEGIGLEPLFNALARYEGGVPSFASVLDWAAAVQRRAPEFGELSRTFHFVWLDGEIDARESWIFCESLARIREDSHPGSPPYPDIYSARFKSIEQK